MHRLIQALLRQPVDRPPIWVMRQAGRYLPEYRELRQRAGSFLALCKTPELACEATLQPLARYPLDAAIVFSDILTIPDAMGLGLSFHEGEGPRFARPVRDVAAIDALPIPDPETDLNYVLETIRQVKVGLDDQVPLIGFAGSPWTLAAYMVEGRSSKNFSTIKTLMLNEPKAMQRLLQTCQRAISAYLNAQISAGADVVMVFDSWGGVLSPDDYRHFSLEHMHAIVNDLLRERNGQRIPIILFTKAGGATLEWQAATGCDALGLDWTVDLADAFARVGDKVALQGNLDPAVLRARPEVIVERAQHLLKLVNNRPGYVFNLGHGIEPDIPPEHMAALVNTVTGH